MDGEVNNRTARITQDVKRDNTDAGDRQTQQTHKMDNTRQTQQTHKMDRRRRTQTKRDRRRRDEQTQQTQTRRITRDGQMQTKRTDTTDADEMDIRRERLSVGNELTSRRGLIE